MNQYPGILGRKIGMTQVFTDDGSVIPCTVVAAEPTVVGKRTQEKDGYDALILGLEERKEKHTSKPLAGFYAKAGVSPKRIVREFRCSAEYAARLEPGATLKLDELFEEGQFVDVKGVSRGRGFAGVMRRHNFRGQTQTHGTHEYKRHGGSIGSNMTPGRVFKGKKMAGQMGNKAVSVLSQKVVKVVPEENLVLIRGGIPGPKGSVVMVKGAVKKWGGPGGRKKPAA